MFTFKNIIAAVVILLCMAMFHDGFSLQARCKEESYAVLPPSGDVPANVRIIIEGFGNGQHRIENIKLGEARLVSGRGAIKLTPEAIHIGQYLVTQVILKPSEPLLQGDWYSLEVDGISPDDFEISGNAPVKGWRCNGSLDLSGATWRSSPIIIDRKSIDHGTTPSEWIRIKAPVNDDHLPYVLVKLKTTRDKAYKRSYILPVKDDMILVGHGACSGPFNINSGCSYIAKLIPYDISGNTNEAAARKVSFSDPGHRH